MKGLICPKVRKSNDEFLKKKTKIIQEIAGRGAQMVKLNEQLVEEVGRVAKLNEDNAAERRTKRRKIRKKERI